MIRLDLPVTPLARGMHMWLSAAAACESSYTTRQESRAEPCSVLSSQPTPGSCPQAPALICSYAAALATTTVPTPSSTMSSSPAVNNPGRPKKDIAAPYRSVDLVTGRVWGMPNSGGRGQCFDCPKRAMPGNHRCQSCLRALADKVHERMSPEDVAELRRCFDYVLARLRMCKKKDTADRLQELYFQLQAGRISPDIQCQLLRIAHSVAAKDPIVADRTVKALSTQHWEVHKEWLIAVKRLLPVNV